MAFDTREQVFGAWIGDGLFAGCDLIGSSESLGSDVSLLGVFGQLKLFGWPGRDEETRGGALTWAGLTWAQSFRAALLEPYGGTEIPASERLRAGGAHSVRGYRTESLGPLDDEGNALGGEVLFAINQELRFPLPGDWDIAVGGSYDYKEVYDSFGVGVSFGKRFGKPR